MPGKKRTYQPHKRRRKSVHGFAKEWKRQMVARFCPAEERKAVINLPFPMRGLIRNKLTQFDIQIAY